MLKWSRERRACAGMREASRRNKAMRLLRLNHALCPGKLSILYDIINALPVNVSDKVVRGEF